MNNRYFILRHGEALSNKKGFYSCWPEKSRAPLTGKGRKQIETSARKLRDKDIDLIFSSDLLRTKQSAGIVGRKVKAKPEYDKRLREYNVGVFNGESIGGYRKFFPSGESRLKDKAPMGENYTEVKRRVYDFFKEIDRKYKGKNILIVSHQLPLALLEAKLKNISDKGFFKKENAEKRIKTGELRELK